MGDGAAPRVALIAGEPSGDALGAGLMHRLREHVPQVRFEGIGGPRMTAAGLQSQVPMERLSLMGLTEILRHLPGLLRLRHRLVRQWRACPPDVFVGIDVPDFNLGVERRLKRQGIPTVHYVSPTVWAWRRGRIRSIRRSVDRMLTLFPFEQAFYEESGVDAVCVGHPAADAYPMVPDRDGARAALGLSGATERIALLPGSRGSEVERLMPAFAGAAARLAERPSRPGFIVPVAREWLRPAVESALAEAGVRERTLVLQGRADQALAASDAVLTASGTATLEAMLAKRPMVSAYRLSPITFQIIRRLIRVPWSSKPNLLAQEALVPEFFQGDVNADALAAAVARLLDDPSLRERLVARFTELHRTLARDADGRAAEVVAGVLAEGWSRDAEVR